VHYLSGGGLVLNVSKPPFEDVRVRKAASLALNRDALIRDVVDGHGAWMGVIASSFKSFAWPQDRIRQHPNLQYNPEQARSLVKEAGVEGLAFPINGSTTAGAAKVVVDMVEQMWKSVGLNPVRDMTDIPTSYQKRVTGDYTVFGEGVGFTSASLDAATRQLFHTKGERNYGRVSDPVIDDLSEQQFGEMNVEKRAAIVDKIQERVLEQMWFIPTYVQIDTLLDHNWVVNKPWFWQLAWAYPERIWYDKSRTDV
jgi:peptide/nickel transport system substrate-binding protein